MSTARNIETKARCPSLAGAARAAARAGARHAAILEQRDTYFDVPAGRLKVREIVERSSGGIRSSAELIAYRRRDVPEARVSSYSITAVDDADRSITELTERYGRRATVTKRRELWLLGSTRIHLDRVDGLGEFVELETVAGGDRDMASLWDEHRRIADVLELAEAERVSGSYVDLVERD